MGHDIVESGEGEGGTAGPNRDEFERGSDMRFDLGFGPVCGQAARLVLAVLLGFFASAAHAQYDEEQPQQTLQQRLLQLPIVDLKGKVQEVGGNAMSINCEGQAFVLTVDSSYTRVVVNGEADRGYLKPGVMVRFEGEFDRKMQAKGSIGEIAVVTPSETSQPGIHADSGGEEEQPRQKTKSGAEVLMVIGTIKLIKDDQLQVIADGKPIKVQLDKDVEVKVEVDDFTLAEPGDEIVVRGRTVQPPQGQQAGQVFGEDVQITLANPLESATKAIKKKKSSKSKTAKPVKRTAR